MQRVGMDKNQIPCPPLLKKMKIKTKTQQQENKKASKISDFSQKVVEPLPPRPPILSNFCWLSQFSYKLITSFAESNINSGIFHELMGINRLPQTEH